MQCGRRIPDAQRIRRTFQRRHDRRIRALPLFRHDRRIRCTLRPRLAWRLRHSRRSQYARQMRHGCRLRHICGIAHTRQSHGIRCACRCAAPWASMQRAVRAGRTAGNLPPHAAATAPPTKIEREHHQRDRKHRSNRIKPSPESHRPPPSAAARAQSMSRLRRSAFSSQRRISASARKHRQRSRQTTHATSVAMPNPSVARANSFSSDTPQKKNGGIMTIQTTESDNSNSPASRHRRRGQRRR